MIAAAPMIRAYHGDDQVALRRAFADDLKRWCGDNELGKEVLHLEEFDPARAGLAVLEACQTQSLFAEQRAVVVHEAERFPESALPELSKWLDDPTPGTALFLLFGKWDGRSRTAKRLAAVPDAVRAFDAPKPWEMAKAVAKVAEENGFRTTPAVAERIADLLGDSIDRVRIEFLKLSCYFAPALAKAKGGLNLTPEMVEETIVEQSEGNVFDFVEHFVKRSPSAPHMLRQMLDRGGDPYFVHSAVFNAVCRTLLGSLLSARGANEAEIAAAMGVTERQFHYRRSWLRARPINELERLVVRLEEIEDQMKSGGLAGIRSYELAMLPLMVAPQRRNRQ